MRSRTEEPNSIHRAPQAVYEIQVEGELDRSWEEWFSGLTIRPESAREQAQATVNTPELPAGAEKPSRTTLAGPVADQAALRGMLCQLWDLNLTVISVRRTGGEESRG